MSFEVHPILEAGDAPRPSVWYAVSPPIEDADDSSRSRSRSGRCPGPSARVGSCATFVPEKDAGVGGGSVTVCAGATPEKAFSDLFELRICKGDYSK